MNILPNATRRQIVAALVEGNSIRSTCRMTGAAKATVTKLLLDLGAACSLYHHEHVRGLACKRIQCDEIWSFVGVKDRKKEKSKRKDDPTAGSVWTWVALCTESKIIASFHVGSRDAPDALILMRDLASRLTSRIQLTTDGHKSYLIAVPDAFGDKIDYAMLVKQYGDGPDPEDKPHHPSRITGISLVPVIGEPEMEHISTSYIERQNLTIRMSQRRFTRKTNAFSKKKENHAAAVALHVMHYNFVRIHQTLRVTPAMAAGVTDRLWSIDDLIALLPAPTRAPWGSRNGRVANDG